MSRSADGAAGQAPELGSGQAPDLSAELYVALGRLVRSLRREPGEAVLSVGLVSALRQLSEHGPMRATALAEGEGIATASMTRIVQALEERELVRRTPDPTDGRAQIVELTDAGRAVFAEGAGVRVAALRRRIASLDAGERAALTAAMPVLRRLEEPVEER